MDESSSLRWWTFRLIVITICLFFIFFGVNLLIGAYGLNVPHYFVLTFFASNLIILISGAIMVGFGIQILQRLRGRADKKDLETNSKL